MKTLVAIAAGLFLASHLFAQTPAETALVAPVTVEAKPVQNRPGVPAKKPEKKVETPAPEPVIPGQTIARNDGTFLGLEVVGGRFKLSFYDQKKKPKPVDVTRATARWPDRRTPGDNRAILNPEGAALVGNKPVLPPFIFNVYLTLLAGDGDESKAVESYVVQFRG